MLNYSYREFTSKVKKLWFYKLREAKGSHEIRYQEDIDKEFVIPKHDKVSVWVIKSFIRLNNLSNKEFQAL